MKNDMIETTTVPTALFEKNLNVMRQYYPVLAEQINTHRDSFSVQVKRVNQDKDYAFMIQQGAEQAFFHDPKAYYHEHIIAEINASIQSLRKNYKSGFVFYGMDTGYRLAYLYDHTASTCPVYIVERYPELLKAVMSHFDLTVMLASGRVFLFVGEDAAKQAVTYIHNNLNMFLPLEGKIVARSSDQLFYMEAAKYLFGKIKELLQQTHVNIDRFRRHYGSLSKDALIERFSPAERRSLRIMGEVNTETKIMQHVMRNCMDTFQRIGHQTLVLEEGGVRRFGHNYYFYRVVGDFLPDMWFRINHTSKEYADLPDTLVTVTWVLDPLYYMFNPKIPAEQKIGQYDQILVMARNFMTDDLKRLGYPEKKLHHFYFGANLQKYRPLDLTDDERKRYASDVSYVGNFHEYRDIVEVLSADVTKELYQRMAETEEFYPYAVKKMFEEISRKHQRQELRPEIARLFEGDFGKDFDQGYVFMEYGWLALSGVALRVSYLESITDLRLSIYGAGWEKEERFRNNARGPAGYGDEVCKIFQASKINVHFAGFTNNHPRVFDIIASGGFLLTRFTEEDNGPGGIGDLFEIGTEIEVYRNKKELRQKIEYYLAHDDERQAIARRGYERLMRDHTMEKRMEQVREIVYRGLVND